MTDKKEYECEYDQDKLYDLIEELTIAIRERNKSFLTGLFYGCLFTSSLFICNSVINWEYIFNLIFN